MEITEVHTPSIDTSHIEISPLSTRMNTKISREYLTQHITYRAQRLASKVEPEMVDFRFIYSFFFINIYFLDNTKTSCSNT